MKDNVINLKPYQGDSKNEINNPNTEYVMFKSGKISNTDWLQ